MARVVYYSRRFLDRIQESYAHNEQLVNLMMSPFFSQVLAKVQDNWRLVVITCKELGTTPAISASLDYYDSYRSAVLPANLIQAQRDYFKATLIQNVSSRNFPYQLESIS